MRPCGLISAFGLIESAPLEIFLAAGFNQNDGAFFGAIVNSSICERDGPFRHATLVRIPLVPKNVTRFKIKTSEVTATVPAVGAEQSAVMENHPAVMIFHRFREPDLLRSELAIVFLG